MSDGPDDREAMALRYARRAPLAGRYSALRPEVLWSMQEVERAMIRYWRAAGWHTLADKRVVEVGCGAGGTLLELLRLGFAPEHVVGIDLLPDRVIAARRVLPSAVHVIEGDAAAAAIAAGSQEMVLAFTVFSSILDRRRREQLAATLWRWLAPGGALLAYDFVVDNPRNPDVRAVPVREWRALFPAARLRWTRVTLAPPLSRALCRVHPVLYPLFNALPLLRTHALAWIEKPR